MRNRIKSTISAHDVSGLLVTVHREFSEFGVESASIELPKAGVPHDICGRLGAFIVEMSETLETEVKEERAKLKAAQDGKDDGEYYEQVEAF